MEVGDMGGFLGRSWMIGSVSGLMINEEHCPASCKIFFDFSLIFCSLKTSKYLIFFDFFYSFSGD
jgi:hypothetical protein